MALNVYANSNYMYSDQPVHLRILVRAYNCSFHTLSVDGEEPSGTKEGTDWSWSSLFTVLKPAFFVLNSRAELSFLTCIPI